MKRQERIRMDDLPGRLPPEESWLEILIDYAAYGTLAACGLIFWVWIMYVAYKLLGGA